MRIRRVSTIVFSDQAAAAGFLAPFLLLLLLFQYLPLGVMVRDSLYSFPLLNPRAAKFVGAANYLDILSDPETISSFLLTSFFAAAVVFCVMPLALLIAMFLNTRLPARSIIRTIVFLPVVTSVVVIATMWTFLLDPTNGLINSTLKMFGLAPLGFLTVTSQALPALILMTVWQQTGFAAVIFLGGLQAIPAELLDAARVDGASLLQRLRFVVIPLLARTTMFVVVIISVFSLQAFAPAFIMTAGGPEGSTNFVVYHIYQLAFALQSPGYASAISVVLLLMVLMISVVQMALLRARWNY